MTDDETLLLDREAVAAKNRPRTGLTVRGYELRDVLGRGAFGAVYRAYQPIVGREVAIKVIAPELADDPRSSGGSRPKHRSSRGSNTHTSSRCMTIGASHMPPIS